MLSTLPPAAQILRLITPHGSRATGNRRQRLPESLVTKEEKWGTRTPFADQTSRAGVKATTKEKLELLLQNLLWDDLYAPIKILRMKAAVRLTDDTVIVQGVNDTYDLMESKTNVDSSIFVFIAKSINATILEKAVYSSL